MNIPELFTEDELQHEISNGYVTMRPHEDDPNLCILNYTKKAQAEGRWNNVTRACRGLIVRIDSEKVIARPFPKFFNYGEHPAGTFDLDAKVEATDKFDGSLGILYPHPNGGWAIATRGSFHSDQAVVGTELLQEAIYWGFTPNPDYTYLFEIIYPENRIVVDYHGLRALISLDAYFTAQPKFQLAGEDWINLVRNFQRPQRHRRTLRDLLAMPPRENAEGWVLRFPDGTRVKVKQEDYIRLHRIVTGLNELTVWEWMYAHAEFPDARYYVHKLKADLPEEFHGWVDEVVAKFDAHVLTVGNRVYREFADAVVKTWGPWLGLPVRNGLTFSRAERAKFAAIANEHEYPQLMYLLADDKIREYNQALLKMVRPKGPRPSPKAQALEVAA